MVKISRRSDGGKSTKMSFKNVRYGSQKTVLKHLNLRLFDVISHFLPNLFVKGIILDYLHLVSENPRPLLFLEEKPFGR